MKVYWASTARLKAEYKVSKGAIGKAAKRLKWGYRKNCVDNVRWTEYRIDAAALEDMERMGWRVNSGKDWWTVKKMSAIYAVSPEKIRELAVLCGWVLRWRSGMLRIYEYYIDSRAQKDIIAAGWRERPQVVAPDCDKWMLLPDIATLINSSESHVRRIAKKMEWDSKLLYLANRERRAYYVIATDIEKLAKEKSSPSPIRDNGTARRTRLAGDEIGFIKTIIGGKSVEDSIQFLEKYLVASENRHDWTDADKKYVTDFVRKKISTL